MIIALVTIGIACIVAAIVGGGTNVLNVSIPLLKSNVVRWSIGILGVILCAIAIYTWRQPQVAQKASTPTVGDAKKETPSQQVNKKQQPPPKRDPSAKSRQLPPGSTTVTVEPGGNLQQNADGPCGMNIIGNNNSPNCTVQPQINASQQVQRETGNTELPWETTFTITTSALAQMGDLRLKCSGPVLRAGISRINPSAFSSGTNGPDQQDPNTVVYQLGSETLAPGKIVTIAVYARAPITVVSGTIGPNQIHFVKQ